MCNRYDFSATAEELVEVFQIFGKVVLAQKQSVWPLYQGVFVRPRVDGPGREAALAQWGLVPHWAPDMKFGRSTNNARADGIATKPSFRTAFKKKRCLIPATAFYEPKDGTAYKFTLPEQPIFALAGLWEVWGPKESPQESYTMITTEANAMVAEYHAKQRMPVILEPSDWDLWLTGDVEKVGGLLQTYAADRMRVEAAGKWGGK